MRLEQPCNPRTGFPAIGTVDTLEAVALFASPPTDVEDDVKYEGDTDIVWESQKSVTNDQGQILVLDERGDMWYSHVYDE